MKMLELNDLLFFVFGLFFLSSSLLSALQRIFKIIFSVSWITRKKPSTLHSQTKGLQHSFQNKAIKTYASMC